MKLFEIQAVQQQWRSWDERFRRRRQLLQQAHTLQSQRQIACRGGQPTRTKNHFRQWVQERFKGSPILLGGTRRQHCHPQFERVHVLPTVHLLQRLGRLLLKGGPQQQGQLSDVHERVLVRRVIVQTVQLHNAIPHEGEGGEGRHRRRGSELGPPAIRQICLLHAIFDERERLCQCELPDAQESVQSDHLKILRRLEWCGPQCQ